MEEKDKQTRIRWDDDELGRVAEAMAPRLLADPQLHPLDAVRAAQDCLAPERRRELKAWSLVEGRLQPKLDEALARLRAASPQPASGDGPSPADGPVAPAQGWVDASDAQQPGVMAPPPADAEEAGTAEADASGPSDETNQAEVPGGQSVTAQDDTGQADAAEPPPASLDLFGDRPAQELPVSAGAVDRPRAGRGAATAGRLGTPAQAAASVTVDPATIEAALLAALQSPAVEDALVELFSRTMAKALLRVASGDPRQATAHPSKPATAQRVLLAGFPDAQHKALADAIGESFDVRAWKPANGPQAFQALARLCRTVVFPEEADDEVEASLKGMDVRVIRHAGSASRLIERLGELG